MVVHGDEMMYGITRVMPSGPVCYWYESKTHRDAVQRYWARRGITATEVMLPARYVAQIPTYVVVNGAHELLAIK